MRKKIICFLATYLLTFNGEAYQFTEDFNLGIYWSILPIKVAKVADNAEEGIQLDRILAAAEREWEDVVGVEIWDSSEDHYIGGAPIENVIRWSNNFGADTGFSPDTTLAVTIRYRLGTYFDRFEIILNGENPFLRANSGGILYQTMLHELGHVLGIGHASRAPAVMEASLQGYNELQEDDEDAITAIYNETLNRQETGFVSALAQEEQKQTGNALACGSIDTSGGPGGGLASLFLGALLASTLLNRKFFPKLYSLS